MAAGGATTAAGGLRPVRRASRTVGMSPSNGRWQVCSTPTSPQVHPCRSTRSGTRRTTRRREGSGWNTSGMRAHRTILPGDRTIARAHTRIRRPGKSLSIVRERRRIVTRAGSTLRDIYHPGKTLRTANLGGSPHLSIIRLGKTRPCTFHPGMVRLCIIRRERTHLYITHQERNRQCIIHPGSTLQHITHQESTLRCIVSPGKNTFIAHPGKSIAHPGKTTSTVLGGRTTYAVLSGTMMPCVHQGRIILLVPLRRTTPGVLTKKSMYGVRRAHRVFHPMHQW